MHLLKGYKNTPSHNIVRLPFVETNYAGKVELTLIVSISVVRRKTSIFDRMVPCLIKYFGLVSHSCLKYLRPGELLKIQLLHQNRNINKFAVYD